ncbi:FliA/WhiG family RNA polymerase sigma factor [Sphingomonas sp. CARO-RG-8B-R24-01]|uniref:sigma-70 family RNA polymerase sigma factor n=1 Tax=Sphingomonas sp. CARO-RG-8B-R24-01 TaxID=2914831 RepID=UPI001F55DD97|nr:FliA/WhiG family RNA polymerase sigma factor [Sphingomonas sp. CARO-RG-8B-R24-01]
MMQLSPTAFSDAQPLVYGRTAAAPDLKLLAKKHLPLVRRIAWHVHGSMSSSVEVEDLVQIGLVALVEAAGAFEERGQVTFEQYLMTRVRGAMIDALRRSATLTRGAMQRKRLYAQTVAAMTTELGSAPDEAAVAARLGVSHEKLRIDYASAQPVRLEPIEDLYSDEGPWFASDEPDAFAQLSESEERDTLITAITSLPEREALVIQLYYVEEMNLEEIGLVIGVGAARVCQIKASAHAKLKKAMLG